jgi:uncharacterized protein
MNPLLDVSAIQVSQLFIYPVKSCRGISLAQATVLDEGLANDRRWMIVDANGRFMTQRDYPQMACIVPSLNLATDPNAQLTLALANHDGELTPDSQTLAIVEPTALVPINIQVWNYAGAAIDCGESAAQFLSAFLKCPARLVRFDPNQTRICNKEWTKELDGRTYFSDGYPILILGQESVDDLAKRMNDPAVSIDRFRPNIVLTGLPAYEEDFVVELVAQVAQANPISFKLVKPCPRCSMPRVDQKTGVIGLGDPTGQLGTYRYHEKAEGAVLGINALAFLGQGTQLRVGQTFDAVYDF